MITIALVVINILVYANFLFLPIDYEHYIGLYGLNNSNLYNPIIWITSMFLHAGIAHIAMNMIALLQVGLLTEKNISSKIMFFVYFLSGLGGSLASVAYIGSSDQLINVVGASGAIFGLFAFYSIVSGQIASFVIQAVIFHVIILSLHLPIAWYAHAGGIFVGVLFALFYLMKKEF
jgi:rhomboid protease GluP